MRKSPGGVLLPPEVVEVGGPVIFLAGPIQGAPNWQAEAINIIQDSDSSLTIASPRKHYAHGEFVYEAQVDWETHYLRRAAKFGTIMFWLACQEKEVPDLKSVFYRSYAQTTRQELGEWRTEKKHDPSINLVVGIEKGFGNARYTRRRLEQDTPDVPILDNLGETCQTATTLAAKVAKS
jgi:hypothetical protein